MSSRSDFKWNACSSCLVRRIEWLLLWLSASNLPWQWPAAICHGQNVKGIIQRVSLPCGQCKVCPLIVWSAPDLVISWLSACCGKGRASWSRVNALNVLQEPLPGPDAFVSNGRIVAEYPSRLKYKAASTPVPIHPPEVQ